MKKQQLLHTPEGVRDIYSDECEKKLYLEDKLHHILRSYGCRPIQTPSFEFFDIFGKEIGTTRSKDLYRFFDREGNTLALRPDITPSIARCAAKYFKDEELPLRFCYKGNTFINTNSFQGRLKEYTQLGAELIADASVDADAEMLAMIVECLLHAGLKNFQISVGHVGILEGMIQAAGLNDEEEDDLYDLILNNNFFGVEAFLESKCVEAKLKELFSMLGQRYSSAEDFIHVKELAKDYPKTSQAFAHLEQLQSLLLLYGIDQYISFELGAVSSYHYYTGIIFQGYTFGSGEPIVKGGRYDSLLGHFGKDAAAIGFVIVINQLMAALARQGIDTPIERNGQLVVYDEKRREDAIIYARKQRACGCSVELTLLKPGKTRDDYMAYAKRHALRTIFMYGE